MHSCLVAIVLFFTVLVTLTYHHLIVRQVLHSPPWLVVPPQKKKITGIFCCHIIDENTDVCNTPYIFFKRMLYNGVCLLAFVLLFVMNFSFAGCASNKDWLSSNIVYSCSFRIYICRHIKGKFSYGNALFGMKTTQKGINIDIKYLFKSKLTFLENRI